MTHNKYLYSTILKKKKKAELHAMVDHQGNRELFTTLKRWFSISEALKNIASAEITIELGAKKKRVSSKVI